MKHKIMILMVLVIFISACSSGDNKIEVVEVHKGSQGLEFDFIKNMPPDSVYSNQDFQLGIRVINKGAYDIDRGVIKVTGDSGYISFNGQTSSSQRIRRLEGKTNFDPRDKEDIFRFDADVTFADRGFEEHDSVLIFSACYDYSNVLTTQICVDPDVYDTKPGEKNCNVESLSFSGQGGPVGIAFVEPYMMIRNDAIYPQFKFTIRNFGQGEVFSPGESEAFCSSRDIRENTLNFIRLKRIEFSDITLGDMDCFPSNNEIILKNGQAEMVCTLKDGSPKRLESNTDSYTSSLIIELEYGYSISKSKTIKVINQDLGD